MDSKHYPVTHTDAEWRKLLTPEQFRVMRDHGTEPPGSCALNHEKRAGKFTCAGCGQELFVSKQKFESGTGWPSFNDPARRRGRDLDRPSLRHGAHRSALQPLRQPPRPRLRGRPAADASALLHQRRGDELQGGVNGPAAFARAPVCRSSLGPCLDPIVVKCERFRAPDGFASAAPVTMLQHRAAMRASLMPDWRRRLDR